MTITTASPTASIQQALADVAEAIDEIKSLTPSELASAHTRMKIYSALQGAEGQSVYTPDLQKELGWTHACAVDILIDDDTYDACYDLLADYELEDNDEARAKVSKALDELHREIYGFKVVRSCD